MLKTLLRHCLRGTVATAALALAATATSAADNGDVFSIGRFPDGSDTDVATNDWTVTSMPTPGAPNQ